MIIKPILNFAASKPKLRHLARITHMLFDAVSGMVFLWFHYTFFDLVGTSKADLINKVVKEGLDATLKEELLKYAQNSQIENISVAMLIDDVKYVLRSTLKAVLFFF